MMGIILAVLRRKCGKQLETVLSEEQLSMFEVSACLILIAIWGHIKYKMRNTGKA